MVDCELWMVEVSFRRLLRGSSPPRGRFFIVLALLLQRGIGALPDGDRSAADGRGRGESVRVSSGVEAIETGSDEYLKWSGGRKDEERSTLEAPKTVVSNRPDPEAGYLSAIIEIEWV